MTFALRLLLLAAYLPLAHLAESRQSQGLAVVALADLALMVLIDGLAGGRRTAWLGLAAAAAVLAVLHAGGHALPPLLLVPPTFTGLIGYCFARSLRPGRVPLIAKPVAALYGVTPADLNPAYQRYTRRLTFAWAAMLGFLTAINAALALIAVPNGLLAQFGLAAPLSVTTEQWSAIAHGASYGLLGVFAVVEYQLRRFVFDSHPYRNAFDFARKMAALGPAFWRDFFRSEQAPPAR